MEVRGSIIASEVKRKSYSDESASENRAHYIVGAARRQGFVLVLSPLRRSFMLQPSRRESVDSAGEFHYF